MSPNGFSQCQRLARPLLRAAPILPIQREGREVAGAYCNALTIVDFFINSQRLAIVALGGSIVARVPFDTGNVIQPKNGRRGGSSALRVAGPAAP